MPSPYDILAKAMKQARSGEFMEAIETVEFAASVVRDFPELTNKDSFKEMAIAANHYIWELMEKETVNASQDVYFIADSRRNLVKIGVSQNPLARLSQVQIGNGNKLELLKAVAGGKKLESLIHSKFAHLNTSGEWFKLTKELVEYIEEL
jgi:regulatory protein YycH of two-component signal transduction system YycFG